MQPQPFGIEERFSTYLGNHPATRQRRTMQTMRIRVMVVTKNSISARQAQVVTAVFIMTFASNLTSGTKERTPTSAPSVQLLRIILSSSSGCFGCAC